jgi:hypothetical protein
MNSQEFVLWLKGFTEGVHEYNITPKQWDLLKERLAEVSDKGTPVGVGGWGTIHKGTAAAVTYPAHTSITFTTGSNVTYTTNGTPNWYTVNKTENDSTDK